MTPRGHHAASIQLLRLLHSMTGADPVAKSLIDRCEATPPSNDAPFAMAYDTYLTSAPGGLRWGFTINDRFDDDFDTLLREFAAISGHRPNLVDRVAAVRGALDRDCRLTLGVGFDAPQTQPRLKLYLQEDTWGEGVSPVGALAPILLAAGISTPIPAWISPDRRVGVVTLELADAGWDRAKIYLGGQTPQHATEGGPPELQHLARRMAKTCPHPGFYYATVRLYPGRAPATAINKIYALAAMDYGRNELHTLQALRDVAALFKAAGRLPALKRLLNQLRSLPELRAVPTATALEDQGRSVDCYFAAFPTVH